MSHTRQANPDAPSLLQRLLRYPLILGGLFSTLLFMAVVQVSINEHERDFSVAAQGAGIDFREHLVEGEMVINSVALFFNASSHVTEEEFSLFIGSQFSTHIDIKSVRFLAHSRGENRYAGESAVLPLTVSVSSESGEYPLHSLYRVVHPDNHFSELGWEAWHAPRTVQAIAGAITLGEVAMGGMVTLDDGSIAFSQYKAVYAPGESGGRGELLGVIAVLFRPADVLEHIAEDYQVNAALRIGERAAGAFVCCRDESGMFLPAFADEDMFDLRGTTFQLNLNKGLGWEDVHMKVAVLAFVIGALLSMVMHRLRMANVARTQLLMERNRTIKRQVQEQTRALRQANIELEQQKAALDEHAIVSIADTSGNITYVNEKFCEISGYHSDELMGRNHRIVKSDRHPPEFYEEMWSTISQGNVWHGEVCNCSKSGEDYWVHSTIVPFLSDRGIPYQYVSIRTDITAMKAAKLAITAHESELSTILNTVPALIWYQDLDSNIVRANKSAAALAGMTPEEMAGRPHSDFFPPEAMEHYHADDLKVVQSGEPLLDLRESLSGADGVHHFRVDRVPYRDELGEIVGLIVVAHDVTRQEETERAMVVNEERLRRSQTFANIGTWDWNIQSDDLFWSERIAPLFGYEVGALETTYENFLNAVHPDDRELVTAAVGDCVESGAEYNIEHRVVWPDGQVRWVLEKGDVVRDEEGAPLHMLGVVQDIHDRKMAEAALAESEHQLREAQGLARIGNWQADMLSGELTWSDEIYHIFGHEPGSFEPSVEAFKTAIHPDDRVRVQESEKRAKESGRHDVIHRIVRPDGTVRHVHELAQAVTDTEGNLIRLRGTVQDVTERVEAEGRMRESEERFAFAVEGAGDGIWDWDMRSNTMQFSRIYMEMLGYEENELPSHADTWVDSVYPDDMPRVQQILGDYLEGRLPAYNVELRLRCKGGNYKWILCRGTVVERGDDGKPVRMIGIHSDITVRKSMEQLMGRQKSLLDMLHISISSFVVQSDFSRTVNVMLDGLLELTGSEYGFIGEVLYDDDGLPYLKTHSITNIAWNEETQALYEEYAEKGFEFRNRDSLFGHVLTSGKLVVSNAPANDPRAAGLPQGHPPMHAFLGVPVYYGEEMVGMYGIANRPGGYDAELRHLLEPFDSTYGVIIHSRRMQQLQESNRVQLLEAKEEAIQANKAKSEFLSSMSHELRTPLNAVLGFTQLMEGDENLTGEQRESLHDIANAGTHLLELINEVLDLAKIEAGKMELSISTVAVADVMAAGKNLIAPMVEKSGLELMFAEGCFAEHFVHADFTRTKQVLLNLLSNAVKYNRNGGSIQVECQAVENERLRISVSDTGEGIPEVKLKGLFEAFNRLDAEGSNVEGTGIGLVITRQLVELMGGEIGVDTVVGEGSTFWFELPRAEQGELREKHGVGAVAQSGEGFGAGRSVLYIEDNPVNLKLVSKLIEKRSAINLLSAEEPVHGIELAMEHKPDLILLDINLPEMSGYEVLRHLREMAETRDIPVIALSANAMADDLKKGESAGFNGYLTKPINVKAFLHMLEKMLGEQGGV